MDIRFVVNRSRTEAAKSSVLSLNCWLKFCGVRFSIKSFTLNWQKGEKVMRQDVTFF